MQFHDAYRVKSGDSLSRIARSKGYLNPGPIVAYYGNKQFFHDHSPDHIRPGEVFLIPWHPDWLRKFIATMEDLVQKVQKTARELIEGQKKNREDLEQFLVWIDSINLINQILVSISALSIENAAAEAGGGSWFADMETKALWSWLADSSVHLIAGDIAPLMIPQPDAPKQDYRYYLRHSLGPWTPSYWASVYAAIKTGDVELYLFGSEAIVYRNAKQIADNANLEVIKLQAPLNHAKRQLIMPFYYHRI